MRHIDVEIIGPGQSTNSVGWVGHRASHAARIFSIRPKFSRLAPGTPSSETTYILVAGTAATLVATKHSIAHCAKVHMLEGLRLRACNTTRTVYLSEHVGAQDREQLWRVPLRG